MKRISNPAAVALWIAAAVVTLLLYGANIWFGELNQDEGWYLYAAQSIVDGRLPFTDFATTQGPVLPFVYVLAVPLVDRFGILGGRLFTGMLGILCAGAGAWLAARLAGQSGCGRRARGAALLAFILIGVSVYQACFFSMVKTYALSALLLLGGALLVSVSGRGRRFASLLGGVLMALAAGTRSSAVVVIPIVFLALWKHRVACRRTKEPTPAADPCGDPWFFLIGAVAAGAAVFLPFCLAAPRAFWFGLVQYHAAREVGGALQILAYKAGFLSRIVFAYFPAVALLLALLVYRFVVGPRRLPDSCRPQSLTSDFRPLTSSLWLSTAAVTLVHFLAPFPYDDYQVMIYPLFAVALAVELSSPNFQFSGFSPHSYRLSLPLVVLLVCAAAAGSSPRNQAWFVGKRDRIWWPMRKDTSLQVLQRAAGRVRELADAAGSNLLLTQDTYLAVEAGLRVPPGLEMGPFSYYPDWDREQAEACHVVNRDMMLDLIRSGSVPVAAFSDYGLAIRSPAVLPLSDTEQQELWDAVQASYRPIESVMEFGQASTQLRILVKNEKLLLR